MAIKAVLFDLDGTLLPMDQDTFVKAYFTGLTEKVKPLGYDPKELIDGLWAGTRAMVKNDGTRMNEAVFWQCFEAIFGKRVYDDIPLFDTYYSNEFDRVKEVCGFNENSLRIIEMLKSLNIRRILATNPIFPAVATQRRIKWAGLNEADFELITTYENTGFCKPDPAYYVDILNRTGLRPEECIMVGNDVDEDMVAQQLGLKVFLLTDCLINRSNKDITQYPHGDFDALDEFLKKHLTM